MTTAKGHVGLVAPLDTALPPSSLAAQADVIVDIGGEVNLGFGLSVSGFGSAGFLVLLHQTAH